MRMGRDHHSPGSTLGLLPRRASNEDQDGKQDSGLNPLLLIFAPVAALALSAVTWFVSIFAGIASLTVVSYLGIFAFGLVGILIFSTQVAGFTLLATGLAVTSLLFKVATIGIPIALVYTALGGKWPALPSSTDTEDDSGASITDKSRQVKAADASKPSAFDEWDARFAESFGSTPAQNLIQFEDLSPLSPPEKLRAFIVQERLPIEGSDKGPVSLYKEIAVTLMSRKRDAR